jgi:hypothetical protein
VRQPCAVTKVYYANKSARSCEIRSSLTKLRDGTYENFNSSPNIRNEFSIFFQSIVTKSELPEMTKKRTRRTTPTKAEIHRKGERHTPELSINSVQTDWTYHHSHNPPLFEPGRSRLCRDYREMVRFLHGNISAISSGI